MTNKKFIEPNNLYYKSRTDRGLSRDKACDLFERISPDRLERIENGKVLPNPEEIMEIAERYGEPEIRNYYCAHQCPMGRHFVKEVQQRELSQSVLQILAEMNRMYTYRERLIEIASQGTVSKEDMKDYADIIVEIEKIADSIDSLLLWTDKAKSTGDIDAELFDRLRGEALNRK